MFHSSTWNVPQSKLDVPQRSRSCYLPSLPVLAQVLRGRFPCPCIACAGVRLLGAAWRRCSPFVGAAVLMAVQWRCRRGASPCWRFAWSWRGVPCALVRVQQKARRAECRPGLLGVLATVSAAREWLARCEDGPSAIRLSSRCAGQLSICDPMSRDLRGVRVLGLPYSLAASRIS